MSDRSTTHEPNDELLSAYLDEELSAEERAAVEARLAADPAARQMLEELRHASQAMRDLPAAPAPDSLRDSILRRAEAAQPTGHAQADGSGSALPKFTIGRTRRGWFWASLAVAAALLIMFVQSDPLDEEDVPPVARLNGEPASLRAAPEAPSASASSSPAGALAERDVELVPRAAGEASSTAGPEAMDRAAEGRTPEFAEAVVAEGLVEPEADELLVVHVLAKREALENNSFDRLLVSNGIAVEAKPPAETASAVADRAREPAASGRVVEQSVVEGPAEDEQDLEMVLVEAQRNAILSCLAELNQDDSNYLGVAVQEAAASEAVERTETESIKTKKLAADLWKYNRGIVPQQQKDLFAREKVFYDQPRTQVDRAAGGAGGKYGIASDFSQQQAETRRYEPYHNQGRAQRVQLPKRDDLQGQKIRELRRELKAPGDGNADRLQVLFVLSAEEQAAAFPRGEDQTE